MINHFFTIGHGRFLLLIYKPINTFSHSQDVQNSHPARPQAIWRAERTVKVREHGKWPRTQLVGIFNILL
jgi:hypothetical protein